MASVEYVVRATDAASIVFAKIAKSADGLDTQLERLSKRVADPEVNLKDAKFTVGIINAAKRIDKLSAMVADPKVTVDTAKAQTEILRITAMLDRLDAKRVDAGKTGGGFWSWITAGIPTLIRNLGNVSSGFTGIISSLASSGPIGIGILAAIAAAAAILATTLTTVGAALIPITIGFAGFAAVAVPELIAIWKAVDKGKSAIAALSPAQRAVAEQVKGLKDQFGKLATAIQPEVLKAFSTALKIIKDLMPAIRPLVIAAGRAIDSFLASMANWLESPSGKAFVQWLKTDGPRDIKTFGRIAWDTFTAIGVVFDHLYRTGVWLEGHLRTLFTIQIPAIWDILRNKVKLTWFQMELDTENAALSITTTMGHLPGPLGKPFRTASADIRRSLATIQQDVRNAAGQVQRDWDRLHGKIINFGFKFQVPGSVLGHKAIPGFAAGTSGAAPGWAWVGERGPELVRMLGGETVVPHHKIGGYALGTTITDTFSPSVPRFLADFNAAYARTSSAMVSALRTISVPGIGSIPGGRGSASLGYLENLWQQAGGPGGYIAHIAAAIAMAESGGNARAFNPSGASGLWQILGQVVGGNIFNPFTNALNAVKKFDDAGGFSPWVTYTTGAYRQYLDQGGWLPPGPSQVYNGTGGWEHLSRDGGGRGITIQTLNITLPPGSDREQGRRIVQYILQFEKGSGDGWRA